MIKFLSMRAPTVNVLEESIRENMALSLAITSWV